MTTHATSPRPSASQRAARRPVRRHLPLLVAPPASALFAAAAPLEGSPPEAASTNPVQAPAATGLFLNNGAPANSASIAVDGAGGTHVAFAQYGGEGGGPEPAYYGYCASGCSQGTSWALVGISDRASLTDEIQLALAPGGAGRRAY